MTTDKAVLSDGFDCFHFLQHVSDVDQYLLFLDLAFSSERFDLVDISVNISFSQLFLKSVHDAASAFLPVNQA